MAELRLIAVDLDGTLLGTSNEFFLYPVFQQKMDVLKQENNLIWAVCTGRTLSSFKETFAPMSILGITPDFVIVNHAYIYERSKTGFWPHMLWNFRTFCILWSSQINTREILRDWQDSLRHMSPDAKTLYFRNDRLVIRFGSEESAIVATNLLQKELKGLPHLQAFRYRDEVDVRPIPFTKGLAVTQLARHLQIAPGNILTIGNGHNDTSMFVPHVARYWGCPANSEPEVIEHVHSVGGHISRERSLAGVLDIIDAVCRDDIHSELPPAWESPAEGFNPKPQRKSRSKKQSLSWKQIFAILFAIYAILVVFANYNLIPFVSRFILIPLNIAANLFGKFTALIM